MSGSLPIIKPPPEATSGSLSASLQLTLLSGKHTHDLRIQAVVLAHNISHILTLNPKDFVEVEGITIVHPNSINS